MEDHVYSVALTVYLHPRRVDQEGHVVVHHLYNGVGRLPAVFLEMGVVDPDLPLPRLAMAREAPVGDRGPVGVYSRAVLQVLCVDPPVVLARELLHQRCLILRHLLPDSGHDFVQKLVFHQHRHTPPTLPLSEGHCSPTRRPARPRWPRRAVGLAIVREESTCSPEDSLNFEFTSEQQEIKERATKIADEEVAPHATESDRDDLVPFDTLEKLADAGFMGLCVPEAFSGAGMDFLSYCLLIEEISRADAGIGVTLAVHTSAGTLPIVMFGTEEQKVRWVPPLARGESIGCFALTEPETGSDASAIKTWAERVDGGYLISGHKQWVTNGRIAGTMVLFARAEGGAREGVTAFVVSMDAGGVSFGAHAKKMGVISATTDDVLFDEVFVSEEGLLGEEGKGLRVALATLDTGRIGIAAQAVGIA